MHFKRTCIILAIATSAFAHAAGPRQRIHGRAHYYYGDGQFRIWHIGTHHDFGSPYSEHEDWDSSWDKIMEMLRAGNKGDAAEISDNDIFADFIVCPIEPFKKGAVQYAIVRRMDHPRLVKRKPDTIGAK